MKSLSIMNINEILKTGVNLTVSVGIKELTEWHKEVIADTRRELEKAVLSEKEETYHSVKQTAKMLSVDISTLWRWKKKGYLTPIEVGGKRRYRRSDIKAILNSNVKSEVHND